MAKKAQKAKAAKKASKPIKKAAVKAAKKATKPAAKKAAPKKPAKASKPVKAAKKPVAKKPVKPVKKSAPAKPTKKSTPVKAGKKVATSKTSKPVKKVQAKKPIKLVKKAPVKPAKAAAPKKPAAKPASPAKTGKNGGGVLKAIVKTVKNIFTKNNVKKTEAAPKKKETPPPAAAKASTAKPVAAPVVRKAEKREEVKPVEKANVDMEKKKQDTNARVPGRSTKAPQPKPQVNTDTRTRYSDAELQEFKELILKKLEEAQKDYELLKSTLSHKDDHGTDDTSPTFKLLEDGSDVLSKEETAHLAARQEKFIQALQNALIRIENKTYGICRVSGKLISKERLRSVPHATLSIDAKLEQNA